MPQWLESFFVKFKKPIIILLALLSLIVTFNAFKLMMADIKGYQAKRMIERWEKKDEITSQADLDYAYEHINAARWYAPEYPKFITYDALIHKWHASSPDYLESPEQRTALLQKALSLYEQEIVQRPTYPYAWTAYANTKMLLGEIDEKFAFAMDRSFYYGPWESQIQFEIIMTGLDAWPALDQDTKKLIFKTFGYAFQGNKFIRDLVKTAEERNIMAVICLKPEKEKYITYVQKRCDKALKSFSIPTPKPQQSAQPKTAQPPAES